MKSMSFLLIIFCGLIWRSAFGQAAVDIDNSDFNTRDQISRQIIAEQGRSKQDIEISRRIRESIVRDKSLSADAQKVRVFTVNGKVTISGLVKSLREHQILEKKGSFSFGSYCRLQPNKCFN